MTTTAAKSYMKKVGYFSPKNKSKSKILKTKVSKGENK